MLRRWTPDLVTALASVGLLLVGSAPLEAQRNCKKGIPCGNTCIAATRTCRIGTSTPRPEPAPTTQPATSAGAPAQALVAPPPAGSSGAQRLDSLRPWVTQAGAGVYYAAACDGGRSIPQDRRLFFQSEAELQRVGLRRAEAGAERCSLEQLQEHERRLGGTR